MATIGNDPNGRRRILFVDADGSRKTIRLGKCDRRTAEAACRHVEALLASKLSGQPIPRETATWLSGIGEKLKQRLAKAGLIDAEPQAPALGDYLRTWLDRKRSVAKPQSIEVWQQSIAEVTRLFGDKPLTALTHEDGERFRRAMLDRGLRATTVHKRLQHVRGMLEDAVRHGLLERNPWRYVRHSSGDVSERRAYIPIADVERILEHCPNVHWRLLIALARFAGLRIPSEAFSLRWRDVDWASGRLIVPSPKTEGRGKPYRVVPLFLLLRPHLEDAFALAPEGAEYVFPDELRQRAFDQARPAWSRCNLRTTFGRIIRRAGLEPWPRLWHSLRASCESDLAQAFPLATVTKWLGNTPSVALRHYVDPTETAFRQALTWVPKAAQNPAQQTQESSGRTMNFRSDRLSEMPSFPEHSAICQIMHTCPAEGVGFEPTVRLPSQRFSRPSP